MTTGGSFERSLPLRKDSSEMTSSDPVSPDGSEPIAPGETPLSSAHVDILLATWNGEKYLPALLSSLKQQTHSKWRVLVRDDGSSDGTLTIIGEWTRSDPDRVLMISDQDRRIGPTASFSRLLSASEAPYFMFCDQDDVWLPEKISKLLAVVQQREATLGNHVPVLAYSDLAVVDGDLKPIAPSLWRYQKLAGAKGDIAFRNLVFGNHVTGCATLGNAALRTAASPVPELDTFHDWWVALAAAGMGDLVRLDEITILYRQHSDNVFGARDFSLKRRLVSYIRNPWAAVNRARTMIDSAQRHAAIVLDRFANRVGKEEADMLADFVTLRDRSFLYRKSFLARQGLLPNRWIDAATFLWFV